MLQCTVGCPLIRHRKMKKVRKKNREKKNVRDRENLRKSNNVTERDIARVLVHVRVRLYV